MYQVIYSSVVVWCAILTFIFMKRALTKVQWVAIIGTSIGLGISSLNSFQNSSTFIVQDDEELVHSKK
jgi:drug/metabolite transporter (DMT)-like permease